MSYHLATLFHLFLTGVSMDSTTADRIPGGSATGLDIDTDSMWLGVIIGLLIALTLSIIKALIKQAISDYKERKKENEENKSS